MKGSVTAQVSSDPASAHYEFSYRVSHSEIIQSHAGVIESEIIRLASDALAKAFISQYGQVIVASISHEEIVKEMVKVVVGKLINSLKKEEEEEEE